MQKPVISQQVFPLSQDSNDFKKNMEGKFGSDLKCSNLLYPQRKSFERLYSVNLWKKNSLPLI